MAAELAAGGIAAGAAGAVTLFGYNRGNFVYDRKMRQETEHSIMEFRIMQAELWREDVRDIIGLTSVKMDTYLVVNAVQLGFCVMAFCEGRLAVGTPTWLIGCHTLSIAGSFMYLLMSVWLAMHASVTAKSYEVRLLTQHVRLPMPTWAQLEGARTYSSAFEKLQAKQMFRVPFLQGTHEHMVDANGATTAPLGLPTVSEETSQDSAQSSDLWGLEARGDELYELDGKARVDPSQLRHLRLVHEAMQYWQAYDGFARVSMSMGTNQFVNAIAYYILGYVLVSNHAIIASWLAVGLCVAINAALIRLDMSLTNLEFHIAVLLMALGPCLTAFSCERWDLNRHRGNEGVALEVSVLLPIVYIANASWFMFLLYIAKVSPQKGGSLLPTGFRSVMYIDIFGWVRRQRLSAQQRRQAILRGNLQDDAVSEDYCSESSGGVHDATGAESERQNRRTVQRVEAGVGPAMQAVAHDDRGRPVPTRPELLTGAAQEPESDDRFEEDFRPTTFVPRAKDFSYEEEKGRSESRPGLVPWRIFCLATVLLAALWWLVGISVLLETAGLEFFKVEQLLDWSPLEQTTLFQTSFAKVVPELLGGEPVPTHWPHAGVRPRGLSCGGGANGQRSWAVASTRFGLFTATLPDAAAHVPVVLSQQEAFGGVDVTSLAATSDWKSDGAKNAQSSALFEAAPPCSAVQGDSMQDVAVQCPTAVRGTGEGLKGPVSSRVGVELVEGAGTSLSQLQHCSAFVLHRQGELFSRCSLLDSLAKDANTTAPAEFLAVAWLGEADGIAGTPQEEVASFTLGGSWCTNGAVCVYAQTTAQRIVELQTASVNGEASWYPLKVIRPHDSKASPGGQHGSGLSMLGADGRFLAVLHPRGRLLEAIDLRGGGDSTGGLKDAAPRNVGYWRLPEGHQWSALCSAGENIYLVSEGLSPQLWRFPFPKELRSGSEENADKREVVALVDVSEMEKKPMSALQEKSIETKMPSRSPLMSKKKASSPQQRYGDSNVVTSPVVTGAMSVTPPSVSPVLAAAQPARRHVKLHMGV
eukprot:TRINITY_DN6838_c0_g1_i2.p1 TRINITY_DN6838_c0_g1~~TRINITY_DN6838_c0_g1_i2.p1  ORF type:complete len:1037 (+),score=170.65 TRINITY_DN6838_c0_g1_i2:91-3201(+)